MANSIIVFESGRARLMEMLMEGGFPVIDDNVTFRLFTNDMTLPVFRVLGDFTEMTMLGYTPQLLTGALDQGIDLDHNDTWLWPAVAIMAAITPVIPVVAFGYYVTHNVDGTLLWGQLFDVPPVWSVAGDSYAFAAQLSLGACCGETPPPEFELFEVDSILSGSTTRGFSVDADVQRKNAAQFALTGLAAARHADSFSVNSLLGAPGARNFTFDGIASARSLNPFTIDGDLHVVPPPSIFVDGFIVRPRATSFLLYSVLAGRSESVFSIDGVKSHEFTEGFSVDSAVRAAPGVLVLGRGSGFIPGPPGITAWSAFITGNAGDGSGIFTDRGGAGGGGGGYAEKINTPVTPGFLYAYGVGRNDPSPYSFVELNVGVMGATPGVFGTFLGGGAPGTGFGGDVNRVGGYGGSQIVGPFPRFGGGGGAAGDFRGDGVAGGNATDTSPGAGGNANATFGSGGHGSNPNNSELGQVGFYPGGAGGGDGDLGHSSGGPSIVGADGRLVITWQAGVFWVDAVIRGQGEDNFTIDGLLAGQPAATFTINAELAGRALRTTAVDGLIASHLTRTFSADSDLLGEESQTFVIDGLLSKPGTVTFQVDADLLKTQAASFTVDGHLANRATANFTIDAFVVAQPTRTFQVDSVVASRTLSTFAVDSLTAGQVTMSFTVDSQVAAHPSLAFTVDGVVASHPAKAFTVDAQVASRSTKTFTVTALAASRPTKTFTVDSQIASRPTKTFTGDGLIASRPTNTFTGDADLWNMYLLDYFVDTNGTLLSAHTPNLGPGWTMFVFLALGSTSDVTIQSNKATDTNGVAGSFIVGYQNAGVTDATATINFIPSNVTSPHAAVCGLVARVQDSSNFWYLQANTSTAGGSNQLRIYSYLSGVLLNRAAVTMPTLTAGTTYTLTLQCAGNVITGTLSGPGITTTSVNFTNSSLNTQTRWGIVLFRDQVTPSDSCPISFFKVQ